MARQGQARVLTPAEMRIIFKIAESTRHSKRNIAMLHASYDLALRACEIRRIRACDILENDGLTLVKEITLLKTMTKLKKIRTIPFVNERARAAFKNYLDERIEKEGINFNNESALFLSQKKSGFTKTSIIHFFENIYKLVNLKGAKSHSGRRTCITIKYYKHKDIRSLQALAGHEQTSTTYKYVDFDFAKIEEIAESNLY